MKLISWNVNGLRAVMNKGFLEIFESLNADILCLQEIKMQEGQLDFNPEGYHSYYNYAKRKGYSGTAVFTKEAPIEVTYGIGNQEVDDEGRVITCEFEGFYLVTVYVPNSQDQLKRIDFRVQFETDFRAYLKNLNLNKPVIMCGDLNVAHKPIDLANPKANEGNAGYSEQERHQFQRLLDSGFIDSYRHIYPDEADQYSWWSYRTFARSRNAGWRIDYFIVSDDIEEYIEDAHILQEIEGSDHCPVQLDLLDI